ncbi:MAG: malate dehydrogenase [Coxiella sp. DG_40]|nr:MAG: malate dehydrogenase [Coxiella sp. DG_40]
MTHFRIIRDTDGNIDHIETSLRGKQLLANSDLNKDTGFIATERIILDLVGKLPPKIETIEEQVQRCYKQYQELSSNIAKYIYLNNLHNRNQTLFYKLVGDYLSEMMPIIYTPTVGEAIEKFSQIYQSPRGLFISYPDKDHITKILDSYSGSDIDLIVVSDAEGILGIGDQGVGGIYICIGKLAVYTLCADINPYRVLPIQLDVGTDNQKMLDDPMYLGWKHQRIRGKDYDDFIDAFVSAVRKKFSNIFLHWEDFGRDTARQNLERYLNKMCTFNDDMQGTSVITSAAISSAMIVLNQKLSEQCIIFHGAGTSATGIADRICTAMVKEGLSIKDARSRIWMLGSRGLITEDLPNITQYQKTYARTRQEISDWQLTNSEKIDLLDVIKNVHPTILIGCSTVSKAFNQEIVTTMAKHVERPVILPLSNPTSKSEAIPSDLFKWTNNKVLVATGSPFPDVDVNGKKIRVAQCNNAFAFPGIGLGIIAVKAKRVTDNMLTAACQTITALSPVNQDKSAPLLPSIKDLKKVSYTVAVAVAKQAIADGVADDIDIETAIKFAKWQPKYYSLTRGHT